MDFYRESAQAKQRSRCVSADHGFREWIDRCLVNPSACELDVFVGVIRGEHDAFRAESRDRTLQCRVITDARGGDQEISPEDGAGCGGDVIAIASRRITTVQSPEIEGQVLSHMSEDHLGIGMFVENAFHNQTQRMGRGVK